MLPITASFRLARRLIVAAAAIAGLGGAALAHDFTAGPIKIEHPWMRVPPAAAKVAGGFMKITNTGTAPDRLVGGTAAIAGRFEVHEMSMKDGVMIMRQLQQGLELKPGATVELKPGSYHVMMMDLKGKTAVGEDVKATLTFEKAGKVDIVFKVEPANTKASGHGEPKPAAKDGAKHAH